MNESPRASFRVSRAVCLCFLFLYPNDAFRCVIGVLKKSSKKEAYLSCTHTMPCTTIQYRMPFWQYLPWPKQVRPFPVPFHLRRLPFVVAASFLFFSGLKGHQDFFLSLPFVPLTFHSITRIYSRLFVCAWSRCSYHVMATSKRLIRVRSRFGDSKK